MDVEFVDAPDAVQHARELQTQSTNTVVICDDADAEKFTWALTPTRLKLSKQPRVVVLITTNPRAISLIWWPLISQPNTRAVWINAPESFRS